MYQWLRVYVRLYLGTVMIGYGAAKVINTQRPPLVTDESRWRRVIFDRPGVLAVQTMSESRQRFPLQLDAEKRTLSLTKRDDPNWKTVLGYEQPPPELLTLAGDFDGRPLRARLRRADPSRFLLTSRGFHWINESPFNR